MKLYDKLRTIKRVWQFFKTQYNMSATRLKWQKMNPHNFTYPATNETAPSFPIDKVHVGNYSYGGLSVSCITGKEEGLYIGDFCSTAYGVRFLLGGEHNYHHVSTYPFKDKFLSQPEAESKGRITLEDDVWIGERTTILSGVTLKRGTVVAAGSIVTKSTEPYSIVGGVPAKRVSRENTCVWHRQ